jgi:LPS-assembly lipoprotein
MSSSDRRHFLSLAAALGLAACGFAPAYGPKSAARGLFGRVQVDDPSDKNSFDLVAHLEERLGRPKDPAYRLSYSIVTNIVGLGITSSNAITRYNVNGTANYSLRRTGSDIVIARGKVRSFTSYSASGTVVSTLTSSRDANVRLMRILADQIVTELTVAAAAGNWTDP